MSAALRVPNIGILEGIALDGWQVVNRQYETPFLVVKTDYELGVSVRQAACRPGSLIL
jgi:hypothetical protein